MNEKDARGSHPSSEVNSISRVSEVYSGRWVFCLGFIKAILFSVHLESVFAVADDRPELLSLATPAGGSAALYFPPKYLLRHKLSHYQHCVYVYFKLDKTIYALKLNVLQLYRNQQLLMEQNQMR